MKAEVTLGRLCVSFAAYEAAKLATEFDRQNRDENVDYQVAKLDDLTKKFSALAAVASTAE